MESLEKAFSFGESISKLIEFVINPFIIYSIAVTVVLIVILFKNIKRKNKYGAWKSDTLNLLIFKREYERIPDELTQQLWEENVRLEDENILLKKKLLQSRYFGFILLFIMLIYSYLVDSYTGWRLIVSVSLRILLIYLVLLTLVNFYSLFS